VAWRGTWIRGWGWVQSEGGVPIDSASTATRAGGEVSRPMSEQGSVGGLRHMGPGQKREGVGEERSGTHGPPRGKREMGQARRNRRILDLFK
jgi:hypothetical protein